MHLPTTIRIKKPWRRGLRLSPYVIFILFCLTVIAVLTLNKTYELTKYTFLAYADTQERSLNKDRALPTFIYIPSLEITLPIDEVSNTSLFWKTTSDTASHISSSAVPGERNNIVLYAQNSTDTFGRLTSLRKGDAILVTTIDGNTHEYQVVKLIIASPTEVNEISSTNDETLTLYTSYGFGNIKRFVVKSLPIN